MELAISTISYQKHIKEWFYSNPQSDASLLFIITLGSFFDLVRSIILHV